MFEQEWFFRMKPAHLFFIFVLLIKKNHCYCWFSIIFFPPLFFSLHQSAPFFSFEGCLKMQVWEISNNNFLKCFFFRSIFKMSVFFWRSFFLFRSTQTQISHFFIKIKSLSLTIIFHEHLLEITNSQIVVIKKRAWVIHQWR